jgi:endonuclease-3
MCRKLHCGHLSAAVPSREVSVPITLPRLLDILDQHYGKQFVRWPTDPYEFIVWWHCGYPQSTARCSKGWESLVKNVGIAPIKILAASPEKLATALKPGGMVPELRAQRLREIAMRVQHQYGSDLRAALVGPLKEAKKLLKTFPNIADPGADRILLFAGIAPIAAVPSNNVAPLIRVFYGRERENYGANYRESQEAIEKEVPATSSARTRAYLLLKVHGEELCKRKDPKCEECPVRNHCEYFKGNNRGRSAASLVPGSRR